MEEDVPFQKIAISGPTLSSLIQRSISAPCDIDGLLFGHVTRVAPSLSDDDNFPSSSSSSSNLLIPTITSAISFSHTLSFYDPLGRVHLPSLRRLLPPSSSSASSTTLLGFFVARRTTPLRPSMREFSVAISLLSQTLALTPDHTNHPLISPLSPPSLFFLISSSSSSAPSIHTHEYRAFQLRRRSGPSGDPALEPRSLDIVNIGPAFRGQYSAFSPNSPLPWLPAPTQEGGEDVMEVERESLNCLRRASKEQQVLDSCTQGFDVGRLSGLMGAGASNYTAEMEDLYGKMLAKLDSLARAVEKTSVRVMEQEIRNIKLRLKVAGSD